MGLAEEFAADTINVGSRVFTASLPVRQCPECDEVYFGAEAVGKFELMVAAELARSGDKTAAAFVFMRKVLGLRAVELAELLAVAPETISRWEHGKVPVDHGAIAILGTLVSDRVGTHDTVDRLRALREHRELPQAVNLGKVRVVA